MAALTINEQQFSALQGKVILVTGGSSGIGLATVKLLLSIGATVINVDLSDIDPSQAVSGLSDAKSYLFIKANVTSWAELRGAFEQTVSTFSRIDHVFANAGIITRSHLFVQEVDAEGHLVEPDLYCLNVNLTGVMYTTKLALYYMESHSSATSNPGGRSIVLTASASSFQTFAAGDYTVAKHGVLGVMRSLTGHLSRGKTGDLPVRINAIAPSWTDTGVAPAVFLESHKVPYQTPAEAGKSAIYLMADNSLNGHTIYSRGGKYLDVEKLLLDQARNALLTIGEPGWKGSEDEEIAKLQVALTKSGEGHS